MRYTDRQNKSNGCENHADCTAKPFFQPKRHHSRIFDDGIRRSDEKKVNLLDDHTTGKLNQFVFKALLPALLFMDLSQADFRSVWDGKFVLFCFCATFLSIGIAFLLSLPRKSWSERGEIIQASYRSSAAILGIAFVNNIYGHATMAALMIVGTVPLYNVAAVLILSLTAPHDGEKPSARKLLLRTLRDVATNPIILGILAGMLWSVLKIPQPVILQKSVSYLGNMATPLALIALGASFQLKSAKGKLGLTLGISAVKSCFCSAVCFCRRRSGWDSARKSSSPFSLCWAAPPRAAALSWQRT